MYFRLTCGLAAVHELACEFAAARTWDLPAVAYAILMYFYVPLRDEITDNCSKIIYHVQLNLHATVQSFPCFVHVLWLIVCSKLNGTYVWICHLNAVILLVLFMYFCLIYMVEFACALYAELIQVACTFICKTHVVLAVVQPVCLLANSCTTGEPHVGPKYKLTIGISGSFFA